MQPKNRLPEPGLALQQFFEHAASAMFWKTLEGRYLMVNKLFLHLLGLEEHQVIGRYDRDILDPDILALVRGNEQRMLFLGASYTGEEQLMLTGKQYVFLTTLFPLFDTGGKINSIGGIATDITEQRERQQRLHRLETEQAEIEFAFQGVEEQIRLTLDGSPVTLYTHDRDLRYTWIYNLPSGLARDFFIGKTDWDFIPHAVAEQLTRLKQRALDEQVTVTGEVEIMVDDMPTTYELRAVPMFNQQQEVIGLRCMGIDRTAQRRLERNLAQAQKLAALGRLASGLAHDFNNSLQIVGASLSLIREELPSEHPFHADLNVARQALRSASQLIEQLRQLDSSRPVQRQPIDLNTIIEQVAPLAQRALGKKANLVLALDQTPCLILANQGQLEQVLLNLCINSAEAMDDMGTVTVSTVRISFGNAEMVRWQLQDTGKGMDPQTLEQIFEPHFTTKQGGGGIGLFMCYTTITEHEGTISASSIPGVGTQFVIEFPAYVPPATQ
jgi:PAS domain S-box-containing protein